MEVQILRITRANYKQYLPGIRTCYLEAYQCIVRKQPELAYFLIEVRNVLRVHLSDEDFPGHYFDHGQSKRNAFWVALCNGAVSGTRSGHVLVGGARCELNHLSVHPLAQRSGIAEALYAASEAYATSKHCKRTALFAWADNTAARALQAKMGYTVKSTDYADVPGARDKLCVYSTKRLLQQAAPPIKKRKV